MRRLSAGSKINNEFSNLDAYENIIYVTRYDCDMRFTNITLRERECVKKKRRDDG